MDSQVINSYKYCSNRCQQRYQHQRYIEAWKSGLQSGIQEPYGVSNYIRRYLIEKFGERCQRCGWTERHSITGQVPLNIHHVDGIWSNCQEENLMLLCPNCHALTETFGSRNRGKGRTARYRENSKTPS